MSQHALAKKLNTTQSNIQRKIKKLGYKKIEGNYIFVGNDIPKLQFCALKYLIAISPLKILSSSQHNGIDLSSNSEVTIYTIALDINENYKNSIYTLLSSTGFVNPTYTTMGYNRITYTFHSKEDFNLFYLVINKLSNPSSNLLFYDKDTFFKEISDSIKL